MAKCEHVHNLYTEKEILRHIHIVQTQHKIFYILQSKAVHQIVCKQNIFNVMTLAYLERSRH